MLDKKRANELRVVKAFLADHEMTYQLIEHVERPDIILSIPNHSKIGIEVTALYKKPGQLLESEQQQNKYRSKAVSIAEKECKKRGLVGYDISISFDKDNPVIDYED